MSARDRDWMRRLRRGLRAWYAGHARDLPWRRGRDPYAVWISEIMLQQTTVAAVVPYFQRFLARFPTVFELAAANEDDVLKLWEGLGYYSRARNLHRAARVVVAEHGGRFPEEVAELRRLPGIGRYTAGAIVSFAFDRPAPIVEANTLRVYCRLIGFAGDPKSADGQRVLWKFAEEVLPRREPGRVNHALMELGATLCAPAAPDCPACPVNSYCRAFANGTQNEIPRLAARPEVTRLVEAAIAVRKNGHVLLRRRGPGEWWTGLWDFPRFPAASVGRIADPSSRSQPAIEAARELERRFAEETGIQVALGEPLGEFSHSVTRYRIRLLCYAAEHRGGRLRRGAEWSWVRCRDLSELPLSKPGRRMAEMVRAQVRGQ
ncbi:MAG: A/G-specific adenine glycosylase [Planctomycetales bacterium]